MYLYPNRKLPVVRSGDAGMLRIGVRLGQSLLFGFIFQLLPKRDYFAGESSGRLAPGVLRNGRPCFTGFRRQ